MPYCRSQTHRSPASSSQATDAVAESATHETALLRAVAELKTALTTVEEQRTLIHAYETEWTYCYWDADGNEIIVPPCSDSLPSAASSASSSVGSTSSSSIQPSDSASTIESPPSTTPVGSPIAFKHARDELPYIAGLSLYDHDIEEADAEHAKRQKR